MKNSVVGILISVLSVFAFAQQPSNQPNSAQKQPSPEEVKKTMETMMAPMIPIQAKMTDAALEAILQKSEEPATATRIAKFKKNLYDALLKEGFSSEQSFAIVQNTGLPVAPPIMR